MDSPFRSLTDEEVRQIGLIVEALEKSTFDFLQLEFGDVKLSIGRGNAPVSTPIAAAPGQPVAMALAAPPVTASESAIAPAAAPAVPEIASAEEEAVDDGTIEIVAPLLGRFFAQPEPGAPPFVTVGTHVTADTTVGLIEVMKTYNAVPAGVAGVITKVCVQDAQLVEYRQILFRVRPTASRT